NMQKVIKLLRRRELAGFSSGLFTSAMYVSSLALIIYVMDLTAFTVGDFIALIQTVQNTQQLLAQMAHKLTVFYSNSFYLTDFFTFLDDYKEEANETPEQKTPFPADFQEGIAFEHVSFRYPGQTRDILKDVSFTIRKGERVAIVGDNGSGKTTLLKCLMGLYPVQSGAIRFDQVPVADMDPDDLHNHITVIFQDFMRYYFSVKDNIAVGKIEKANDFANIREVAKETGADRFIRKLPHDYETYIGGILREGQDLSGGQWQKIALSRALFRQGEVFILDEPTAALDPIAELEVFKQFEALTQNKTAIFISHRMAAARLADRILVLRNGRVAELGHHDELIQRNGVYAKMYHMQAKWYA
ncbi:MAG: ABC transporter ATP-binding protein, partial [Clostridia bacterium]